MNTRRFLAYTILAALAATLVYMSVISVSPREAAAAVGIFAGVYTAGYAIYWALRELDR
jgi:hypothetical protein